MGDEKNASNNILSTAEEDKIISDNVLNAMFKPENVARLKATGNVTETLLQGEVAKNWIDDNRIDNPLPKPEKVEPETKPEGIGRKGTEQIQIVPEPSKEQVR